MKLVPHDPKSSQALRPRVRAGSVSRVVVAGVLATAGAGCDIVQGYKDAGDSLFPEQSTHLASPGLRLVSGNYRELGLVAGTDLYLVAREADDDTGKLVAMRYADPHPCEIPRVVRYSSTREPSRNTPLLAYFEEDTRTGTLRFADAACQRYSLTFDEARLPVGETEHSLVVWAGSDLWLATPETGSQELLADEVTRVTSRVFGKRFAVSAKGSVTLFDSTWTSQGTFGTDVGSMLRTGKSLFYLDADGVHRIAASKASSAVLEDKLLVSDACSLASQGGGWVTVRSPCGGGKLVAIHETSGSTFTLPFDANPEAIKLVPALHSRGLDPLRDPFWFFYLRSGDSESERDTLFVRTPAGDEHALGAHSTLRQLRL
ncbi:MAG TPA: hypothetical protein VIW29_09905, partial [Polyangiaceae bacterium]